MKYCSKCETDKPDEDFHLTGRAESKKLHSYCKDCRKIYDKEAKTKNFDRLSALKKARRAKYKAEIIELLYPILEKGCSSCDEKDIRVLEFNHVDETGKLANIGEASRMGKEFLLRELKKCVLLCANCHRRHTHIQFGYWNADWKLGDTVDKFTDKYYNINKTILEKL